MVATNSEILQGDKLVTLFQQLITQKVIVSLAVAGTSYEQLTIITDIEQTPAGNILIIDPPSGFQAAAERAGAWELNYTLIGPDKLEYIFSTQGGIISDKGIRVPFPDHVQRLQRRKNFRVNVLPNTKLLFMSNNLKAVIMLNNISMGGAFGSLVKHNLKNAGGPVLELDQELNSIAITFPAIGEVERQVVMIKKAHVVRIERNKRKRIDQYALEFLDIGRDQEQLLTQAIYQIQRYYLKNR